MFNGLKNKWKVSWLNFVLIFCTFAIGGSLTGYVTRKLFKAFIPLEAGFFKGLLYIIVLTIIWPFMVLFISLFFGQFRFFKNYVGKLLSKFKPKK
jgi:hypothetical protein